jgi:carboxypeptidase Taq
MLGNLYAAQFYAKAKSDIKDLEGKIEKGDLKPLLHWLRENIHSQGRRYSPEELLKVVTGKELDPEYFIRYIKDKYSNIYSL